MSRLTKKTENDYLVDAEYLVQKENSFTGEAVDKLAAFENFAQHLAEEQVQLTAELEELKAQGKGNTVRFRQLFANKLTGQNTLILLKRFGIE